MNIQKQYTKEDVTVIILAGGQGRRMGNKNKGLLTLSHNSSTKAGNQNNNQNTSKKNHITFVSYLIKALSKQTRTQIISANDDIAHYAQYDRQVIPDSNNQKHKNYQGPLAGIISCKPYIKTSLILTIPCDSPLAPTNLVEKLLKTYNQKESTTLCVAHDGERLQNLFMLFNTDLLENMSEYFHRGERKVHTWIAQQNAKSYMQTVDFSDQTINFTNVNDQQSLSLLLNIIEKTEADTDTKTEPLSRVPTPVIGFAAWSGTGKTTLLEKVIPLLQAKGLKIGIIKHAHHDFDIDHQGKDSYRLRKAGAVDTIVASAKRWALIHENEQNAENVATEPNLSFLLAQIATHSLDLILVEGFKHEAIPRIELHRAKLNKPLLYPDDKEIIAIATDSDDKMAHAITRLNINSPAEIVIFLNDTFNLKT